jgi:hypothetical protein
MRARALLENSQPPCFDRAGCARFRGQGVECSQQRDAASPTWAEQSSSFRKSSGFQLLSAKKYVEFRILRELDHVHTCGMQRAVGSRSRFVALQAHLPASPNHPFSRRSRGSRTSPTKYPARSPRPGSGIPLKDAYLYLRRVSMSTLFFASATLVSSSRRAACHPSSKITGERASKRIRKAHARPG